ncbi:hypothetical protein AB0I77_08490 [Streptomyces sp. NPDC050619]|uniref:hypothetical protein n=1 Tax=Streptomyces sp. NPDC050619 TaxID=3157214 RepID=UPI0034301574
MSVLAVEDSWSRIEAWLRRHAPVSHALLRPPAAPSDIETAERALGVGFHPDLVASLRCHDGVELEDGAPVLAYYGPPSGIADIVKSATFLRGIGTDLAQDGLDEDDEDYDELSSYWHHDWLLITLGIGWQSSDGLFLSCRPGPNWGRLGRYFDEDAPSFTPWPSLRHALADYADALESGGPFNGRIPLAVDGVLLWEDERTTISDPVSPLALAAAAGEPEQPSLVEPPAPAEVRPADGGQARLVFVRHRGPARPPLPAQPDLLFAENLTPAELLRRLGALPDTVRPRTRERAEQAADSPWAAYRPLVRAGSVGGWAYATQEGGTAQFSRPEVLRAVSADTRAVALTKRGPEVRLTITEDGVPDPEAARHVMSPREGNIRMPGSARLARRLGVDPWPGSSAAYTRLLAELEQGYGIAHRPDDDADTELTSALLLPVLDDIDPEEPRYVTQVRDFDLAALVERTPPARLRTAIAAQLARLAAESYIDVYDEVADALARIGRGERVDLALDGPLDLRIRTLAAEAWAARQPVHPAWRGDGGPVTPDDSSAWVLRESAARALREFVLLPVPAAAETILHQRMSVHWRTELAADLETS